MNDGMANTAIAALKAQDLNGKVLVTGQDAEVSGIRNILLGDQSMTIYKPIKKLADSVGKLVAAISKGDDTSSIASAKITNANGKDISPILNPVTRSTSPTSRTRSSLMASSPRQTSARTFLLALVVSAS